MIPEKHPYPDRGNIDFDIQMEAFRERERWLQQGMFAFVSWKWIDPLAEWIGSRRVLEVMAGRGWLAKALADKGIEVQATDDYSWYYDKEGKRKWEDPVYSVEKLDALESVKVYGSWADILIMSWPYMDPTAYDTLMEIRKVNPNCLVIYIGESCGGCTADENFFEAFQYIDDPEFQKVEENFERWWGIHDHPYLGK